MQNGFSKLGMMCSTGQSMPLDRVSAHKWFNIRDRYGATRCPALADTALRADRAAAAESVKRALER
jgi:hypothetical protein